MGGREQLHRRSNLDIVADGHAGAVEDDRPVVDERAVADPDLIAVVALERRHDDRVPAEVTEQVVQQLVAQRRGRRRWWR